MMRPTLSYKPGWPSNSIEGGSVQFQPGFYDKGGRGGQGAMVIKSSWVRYGRSALQNRNEAISQCIGSSFRFLVCNLALSPSPLLPSNISPLLSIPLIHLIPRSHQQSRHALICTFFNCCVLLFLVFIMSSSSFMSKLLSRHTVYSIYYNSG